MADLNEIQNTINQNPSEKKLFIDDPAAYLSNNGIAITDSDRENLKRIISDNSDFLNSGVSVGITVGT